MGGPAGAKGVSEAGGTAQAVVLTDVAGGAAAGFLNSLGQLGNGLLQGRRRGGVLGLQAGHGASLGAVIRAAILRRLQLLHLRGQLLSGVKLKKINVFRR
ncbi:hypothetical protein D3C72_1937450 [compost metagenome]